MALGILSKCLSQNYDLGVESRHFRLFRYRNDPLRFESRKRNRESIFPFKNGGCRTGQSSAFMGAGVGFEPTIPPCEIMSLTWKKIFMGLQKTLPSSGRVSKWVQGLDLNQRPSGYEP